MMDVLPTPPAPIRAIGVNCSTKRTIFSVNSSRPKKILGGGGGNSPGTLVANVRCRIFRWLGLLTCFESKQ